MKFLISLTILLILTASLSPKAQAATQDKPLSEWGLGFIFFDSADYPGSASRNPRLIATPFFLHRGKRLKIDQGKGAKFVGAKGKLFELDLSLDASLSSKSGKSSARFGMKDLDYLVQLGPQLVILILKNKKLGKLTLNLPVRAVLSFSPDKIKLQKQGFIQEVFIRHRVRLTDSLTAAFTLANLQGDSRVHSYFYSVKDSEVTQNRSAYEAKSGHLERYASISLVYRAKPGVLVFGGFTSYDHSNSANKTSPLFEKKRSWSAGFGLAITLGESQQRMAR